jgi:hypothetical protein
MWNSLNNTIRNADTLSKFKSELKKIDETENHAVPKSSYMHFKTFSFYKRTKFEIDKIKIKTKNERFSP